LSAADRLARALLNLAARQKDPGIRLQARHAAWATAFSRGKLQAACTHAAAGIRLYDGESHAALAVSYGSHDAGVCARLFLARALALRGRCRDAIRICEEAVSLARSLAQPFSQAVAHVFAAAVNQTLRAAAETRTHATAARAIAEAGDYRLMLVWSSALEGWAVAEQGDRHGIEMLRSAIAEARAMLSDQFLPHLFGMLAEACLRFGENALGLDAIDQAFVIVGHTGECFWEAELHRLRGELLSDTSIIRTAVEVAQRQDAILLALRASASLARRSHPELLARWLAEFPADESAADIAEAKGLLGADASRQ
jgi:hypothetical protein